MLHRRPLFRRQVVSRRTPVINARHGVQDSFKGHNSLAAIVSQQTLPRGVCSVDGDEHIGTS
jgi:hypothetical protein